jgi:serine/threonine protein kinase/Tol biopolymer transport system component
MPSLRSDITTAIRRLSGRPVKPAPTELDPSLAETVVAADPRHGRTYGSYRVLRRLGAGGMGSVYLALDTKLGRHAALKFLSPRLKADSAMLARLQQEARAASSLNHPNILTIYDISEADGEPFIASEFVEGTTLRHALERNLVEAPAALDVARQIASALAPAHAAGIVHRDLKPANVMLRPDGFVKVIDFGLAKFVADGYVAPYYEPLSSPGVVAGTVQYMSPEQARGEPLDQRTDLWSLGVILYEMLSKRLPFDGPTESHVIVAILDHVVPPFKQPSGVPAGVSKILDKALAKDPAKRYQTAHEFHAALEALETPSQILRRQRMFASFGLPSANDKPRKNLYILAALGCLLAAAAIWWWPFYGRERVLGPAWFTASSVEQVTHRGDVGGALLSPDGRYLAYTTTRRDRDRIHLLNLVSKSEKLLPPYSGTFFGFSFSPDSRSLYYTIHDERDWGRLYATGVAAAESKFVLDDIDGPVCFAPDGRRFVFRRRDDKRANREMIVLARTDDTGDQRVIMDKYDTPIGHKLAWSPDGRMLAVMVDKTDLQNTLRPTLTLLSPEGRTLMEFLSPFRSVTAPGWLNHGSLVGLVGIGTGKNQMHGALQQLFLLDGAWRTTDSLPLAVSGGISVSQNSSTLSAVTTRDRVASLWIGNAKSPQNLERWPLDTESVLSFAWGNDGGLLLAEQTASGVALAASSAPNKLSTLLEGGDCLRQRPLAIRGGHRIVFTSTCAANGDNSNLWQLDTSTGETKQLTYGADFDQNADVTPDGQVLVYTSWKANAPSIFKMSLANGRASQLSRLQSRNPAISPDGKSIVCQIRENYDGLWRVAVLSLADGSIKHDLPQLPASDEMFMRWSPDGRALDFVDPVRGDDQIWRFTLADGATRLLVRADGKQISDFRWRKDGNRLALMSATISSDVVLLHNSH